MHETVEQLSPLHDNSLRFFLDGQSLNTPSPNIPSTHEGVFGVIKTNVDEGKNDQGVNTVDKPIGVTDLPGTNSENKKDNLEDQAK
ncbi:hypothetical protein I302_102379 [Kwoniella bestiolae CBS 10118]|uniref:Uncharacterized protein n=1 Tax=Kwoniella bestiolae CBS 10118 TaxID=1296100 RepID=A0A1B9GER0_9TREE|nr:hypothetical protein I302_01070 [Kwoniella bestiolae CBS 10118]OCF29562.1 hypothetical protein I302_01070 [Kwoniella bestiolae CBS 10118]